MNILLVPDSKSKLYVTLTDFFPYKLGKLPKLPCYWGHLTPKV